MRSKTLNWAASVLVALAMDSAVANLAACQELPLKLWQKVSVLTYDKTSWLTTGYLVGLDSGNIYLAHEGTFVIERAITNQGDTVCFPVAGAKYDAGVDSLAGVVVGGDTLSIALSDVRSVDATFMSQQGRVHTSFGQDMIRKRLGLSGTNPQVTAVPLASVRSMRAWHTAGAAPLIGLVVGGAIGFAIGTTAEDDPNDWDHLIFQLDKDAKMAIDIVLGMIIGAGVGYLIGGGNGWRDVDIQQAKLSIVPQFAGRPGVSLTVKF